MGTAAKLSIHLLMLRIAESELTSDISQAMLPGQSVIQSPYCDFWVFSIHQPIGIVVEYSILGKSIADLKIISLPAP